MSEDKFTVRMLFGNSTLEEREVMAARMGTFHIAMQDQEIVGVEVNKRGAPNDKGILLCVALPSEEDSELIDYHPIGELWLSGTSEEKMQLWENDTEFTESELLGALDPEAEPTIPTKLDVNKDTDFIYED
jgi:hypothetical protein